MSGEPSPLRELEIRALTRAVVGASDPHILRIVAAVDRMIERGPADFLIVPLRPRLAVLRPPHPLRFERLMFQPLDPLMLRGARWRPGQPGIPRGAVKPMADHVRTAMGAAAAAIGRAIAGHTTADSDVISRCGATLWPQAAVVLAAAAVPAGWAGSGLSDSDYRPLADAVAALLAEATGIDNLRLDSACGLLSAEPDAIQAMLGRTIRANQAALPMLIAVLLDRLPEAADLLPGAHGSVPDRSIQAATEQAADLLLRQLEQQAGTETRLAAGSLAEAGAAAARIASLLKHLGSAGPFAPRHERLQAVRRRLAASCQARFAAGLQEQLLVPLSRIGAASTAAEIAALETAARGLRVLETESRAVGNGSTYDLLLSKAAEAITANGMRGRLSPTDQLRLVEILAGADAALALLDRLG